MRSPEVAIHTYTAEPIPVRGVLEVDVKYKNYTGTQTLYVVAGQGPTLLGREWLGDIRLDWRSLGIARSSPDPWFGSIAKEARGTLSGWTWNQ